MILFTDIHCTGTRATIAGVLAERWVSERATLELSLEVTGLPLEVPVETPPRELHSILALLEILDAPLDVVVINGYATRGTNQPGLGWYIYKALNETTPVVGVTKIPCKPDNKGNIIPLSFGQDSRPLYVTAAGMPVNEAAFHVLAMHGDHEVPTLVKRAETLCRGL